MTDPRRIDRRSGRAGAAATAHPLATSAALGILDRGGNAVDAAIAAHLVIAVVLPQAAGIGGDLLALVSESGGSPIAYTGTGASAAGPAEDPLSIGASVTTPGMLAACARMHERHGRLPWADLFSTAVQLAERHVIDSALRAAVDAQRSRLRAATPEHPLLGVRLGDPWSQLALAALLREVALVGVDAFYLSSADAVVRAVQRHGGSLAAKDLAAHETLVGQPITVRWGARRLAVQPAPSQGVLLAMAARWVAEHGRDLDGPALDHALIEVTEAAFAHRDDCSLGSELLDVELDVDLSRAARRGGPRAYLHTAGVATADADGMVVSSLSSVFDDFGSCIYVPELGIVLNNRADGFTSGRNERAPGKKPIHTLAPAMLIDEQGRATALATPGADGQVQTLLRVLTNHLERGQELTTAISAPRWRSQSGQVLVERSYPSSAELVNRGHEVVERPDGADAFGAVVGAGHDTGPFAVADWRRQTTGGSI